MVKKEKCIYIIYTTCMYMYSNNIISIINAVGNLEWMDMVKGGRFYILCSTFKYKRKYNEI